MLFAFHLPSGLAEDQEPRELVLLRDSYEEKVERAAKPIRQEYLKSLEDLKKRFMGKSDLSSALAIDEEIKKVRGFTQPLKKSMIGTVWTWGNSVLKFSDGGVLQCAGTQGSWSVRKDEVIAVWYRRTHTMKVDFENGIINSVRDDGLLSTGTLVK
jgi:hypothetical protein